MSNEIWFDPVFGASGDMILGAFIGMGVDPSLLIAQLELLDVDGWSIEVSTETRCGISSTRANVTAKGHHHSRTWSSIDSMLATSELDEAVIEGARSTFLRLGEVEAAQHQVDIDEVHFHEVGAVDAIVDIVGAWICWDLMDRPNIACGPFGLGYGTIEAAHGTLPLPAPATSALLAGWPVSTLDYPGETVTPTGAALLTTMASRAGRIGSGRLEQTSRGAGGRNPTSHPNVLTAHWTTAPTTNSEAQPCVELSTNLDDCSAEIVAYTIEQLLTAGAMDAWTTPIVMKKGRPGVKLSALGSPDIADSLSQIIMSETSTLGVRRTSQTRLVTERDITTVEVEGHEIRIKVSPNGAKPEYEDVAALARTCGRPFKELFDASLKAFHGLV